MRLLHSFEGNGTGFITQTDFGLVCQFAFKLHDEHLTSEDVVDMFTEAGAVNGRLDVDDFEMFIETMFNDWQESQFTDLCSYLQTHVKVDPTYHNERQKAQERVLAPQKKEEAVDYDRKQKEFRIKRLLRIKLLQPDAVNAA